MTAEQLRAGRAMLRWTQEELAKRSGVSVPSLQRLEASEGHLAAHAATVRALTEAFTKAGLALVATNGGGAGVRFAKP